MRLTVTIKPRLFYYYYATSHACGLLLQIVHEAWSVYLSVSVLTGAKTAEPIKMGADSRRPKETDGVDIPPLEWAILWVVRPIEKHWESLLRCMQQKGSFSSQ